MTKWWVEPTEEGQPKSLYHEYKGRLDVEHLSRMKQGIVEIFPEIRQFAPDAIKNQETFVLQNLDFQVSLCNPLHWVGEVFASQGKFREKFDDLENRRLDTIVHGDFHARNILVEEKQPIVESIIWLIDFPHTHIGPTIQDIARLEADIKFGLLADETLRAINVNDLYLFETNLLPTSQRQEPSFEDLLPEHLLENEQSDPQLQKAWEVVNLLRKEVRNHMARNDPRPYYLALLHATLPVLYYKDRSPGQKLYAFISAALLCERLGG